MEMGRSSSRAGEITEGFHRRDSLLDPESMREALSRHLRWDDGRAVEVCSCAVVYHRQASGRSLVRYEVEVRDPVTGDARSETVTGIASDRPRVAHRWDEVAGAAPLSASGQLDRVAHIPELGLLLQVYPFDYRLPALAQLLKDPAPLVASHILTDLSAEERQAATWDVETVRYRVSMRAMIRLTVRTFADSDDAGGRRCIYAKVFNEDEDGQRAFQVQQVLWAGVAGGDEPFTVARPIAYLPAARVLLFDEVSGISFLDILNSSAPAESAVRMAARAIAAFHQLPIDAMLTNPRRRAARNEAIRLAKLGEGLRSSLPHLRPQIDRVVAEIAVRLPDVPLTPTHFDPRPAHVLIDGDRVALLDFGKVLLADPMVDVAKQLTTLGRDWESSRVNSGQRQRLPEIFQEEYFARVPPPWQDRLPAHYALELLSQAMPSHQEPRNHPEETGRAEASADLVRQAQQILAGHVRS